MVVHHVSLRALIAGPSHLHGGQGAWRDRGKTSMTAPRRGQDPLMRYVELRRHTDNEGDRLIPQGAADAERIGRDRLHPPYAALVSADGTAIVKRLASALSCAVARMSVIRVEIAAPIQIGQPRRCRG
jgi:hypothetical protein